MVVSNKSLLCTVYAHFSNHRRHQHYARTYVLDVYKRQDESLVSVVAELENGTTGSSLFSYKWKGQDKKLSFRTLRNGMYLTVTAPSAEIDTEKNSRQPT